MYRITNIHSQKQEECVNRDDLLSLINEKSVFAADRSETYTVQLEQLAEDGAILDSKILSLPLQEIVEEALSAFGLQRERKNFSFLSWSWHKPQKVIQAQEPTETDKQDLTEPVSASQSSKKATSTFTPFLKLLHNRKTKSTPPSPNMLWKGLTTTALVLSLILSIYIYQQSKQNEALMNRVALHESEGKLDVVSRYFIVNYFSGDSQRLNDFLSRDLQAEGIAAQNGQQVRSTIFESLRQSNQEFLATFVISTQAEEDESYQTFRLTLTFQEDDRSIYGYVLTQQPEFSNFTN